jgi:energy-coupling factor transport system substrate-specific component
MPLKSLVQIAMMVAVIEVFKLTLSGLPNIELTSFFIICFTLMFGHRILYVIAVFVLIEGLIFGFGIWWFTYLYLWPLLALGAWLLRKRATTLPLALLSGFFGLSFGFLSALTQFLINTPTLGVASGLYATFAWWVAGIPWDMVHGISNFFVMFLLYRPFQVLKTRHLQLHGS